MSDTHRGTHEDGLDAGASDDLGWQSELEPALQTETLSGSAVGAAAR
jgi:hypothetical protein